MKKRFKRLSKSTISILLSLLMIISTGIVASNAAYVNSSPVGGDGNKSFGNPSYWYFDDTNMNFSSHSGYTVFLIIYHSTYSKGYKMTRVSNTNIYARQTTDTWGDALGIGVICTDNNSSDFTDGAHGYTGLGNRDYYTGEYTGSFNFSNNNESYLLSTNSGTNNSTLNVTYIGKYTSSTNNTLYTPLNKTHTVRTQLTDDNGATGTTTTLGASVKAASYKFSDYNATTATSGTVSTSANSATFEGGRTATVTLSVPTVPTPTYEFVGWYLGDTLISTNTNATYNLGSNSSALTFNARFKIGIQYNITKGSNNNSYGTVSSSPDTKVSQGGSVTFTASPVAGYYLEGWYSDAACTTRFTGTSANPSTTLTVSNVQADVTVYGKFVEQPTKTINVDVDDHVQIAISGSSVSGENQTFTSNGSFDAHVGDVITFTASGKTGEYTCDTLTCTGSAATPSISGHSGSVTVGASDTITITATSKEKQGYYFYVSAGTGVRATVKIGNGANQNVNAGNRQRFYVEDDTATFTITSTITDSNYQNKTITRVKNTIEARNETPVTIASDASQGKSDADGATYFVGASSSLGQSTNYHLLKGTDNSPNSMSDTNLTVYKKTVNSTEHKYVVIPSSLMDGTNDVYFALSDTAYKEGIWYREQNNNSTKTVNVNTDPDPNTVITASDQTYNQQENNQNYIYKYVKVKYNNSSSVSSILIDAVTGDNTMTYTLSVYDGSDVTSFDTYYLGGRFRIKDSDTNNYVYTDAEEGSWQTYSIRMPFTKTNNANEYKLETNQTISELSEQLGGGDPYFIVHDKQTVYRTGSDGAGLNFEDKQNSSNALTLGTSVGLTYQRELLFSDIENNSDGKVVLYFNSSSKQIWYEVEDETDALANSVTLTALDENNTSVAESTLGQTITLSATLNNPSEHVSGPYTYTFYNTTTNEQIGEPVVTSDTTATMTYHEDTVRVDNFKVVVSNTGTDPHHSNKQLRDVYDHCEVNFKNGTLYHTKATSNLVGSSDTLCNNASWDVANSMTDGTLYTMELSSSAISDTTNPNYFEFCIASDYPRSSNDKTKLEGKCPDDFYINDTLSKHCDIEYFSLTVNYRDGDNTEQYAVRTYKVTPRTNCAGLKIYIDTTSVAAKDANGEMKYYPGSIYAISEYTDTKTETKNESETVTYYFAEAVGNEDQSKSGAGMSIAYWNNSLDNIRTGTWANNIAALPQAQFTDVTTAVKVDGKNSSGTATTGTSATNSIFVDMTKLYEAKDSSNKKEFKIYSVELPIWATSFAFVTQATRNNASYVIKTKSWNDGVVYDYSSLLLNPNRVYLLYKNGNDWYSKGVVLDKGLWNSEVKNDVGTKTFKSNVIKYNASYSGDFVSNSLNTLLSERAYSDFTNDKALYFGLFNYDENNSLAPGYNDFDPADLNQFKLVNNLAMRGQTASDYHASVQGLVAGRLDKDNLNSNGYPMLEVYKDAQEKQRVNMPLFDYDFLADDKQSQNVTLIDKQYLGVDFPMYESTFNGIKTYSYDSSTDPNRVINSSKKNFEIDDTWRKAAEYLGYAPFAKTNGTPDFGSGTELDVEFFMTNTGKLMDSNNNPHDITFNFSGDDDVWVYVDGTLVLDLGGDHMASSGTINFTDMKVYYKTAANDSEAAVDNGAYSHIKDTWAHDSAYVKTVDLQALLEAHGNNFYNKDGNTKHTFQMFYMERGAHDSNMSVSYNLPQASGLNIKNEITANNVNTGLKEAALYAANKDAFTYTVSAALASGSMYNNTKSKYPGANNNAAASSAITAADGPAYPANTNTNRVYSTSFSQNGTNKTYTATYPLSRQNNNGDVGVQFSETTNMTSLNNVTYDLSDRYLQPITANDTNLDVSGKTASNGHFTLLGNQMATFNDKITPHSFVQVFQDYNLDAVKYNGSDTPIGFENVANNETGNYYITSYSIYDNHSSTWIKNKSEDFINSQNSICAADESKNSDMFYFSDYGKTADSAAMTVTYYNDIAVGDIRIKKDYNGNANTAFYFKVKFKNIFGNEDVAFDNLVEYNKLTYDVISETGAIVSHDVPYGSAGVKLYKGQTAVIRGIPVETVYKVEEQAKTGTSLDEINKYVKGPEGNDLDPAKTLPTHEYAESFDSTAIKQGNITSTSDDYELDPEDQSYKLYVNMIPNVDETFVNGKYVSTSYVDFTNVKTNIKITFKYYDRSVVNGTPANISQVETQYIVNSSLDDSLTGETDVAKVKKAISDMIESAAVEFQTQALTQNVVDDYIMWSSQAAAEAGIGELVNPKSNTGAKYKNSSDPAFNDAKHCHTNSLSQLLATGYTPLNQWVSYKTAETGNVSDFKDESYFDTGDKALEIKSISVWLYNQPHKYNVNIYGAKTASELSAPSTVTLNGKTMNVCVANSSLTDTKISKNDVFYNQRLGKALNQEGGVDTTSYISQYDKPAFRQDIEPIDYVTADNISKSGNSYRFAYWAFDPAGRFVASTDAYYYYRVTKDLTLYAVYSTSQLARQIDSGLSIFNNKNDTYVDNQGVSRTRMNVVINPYACNDSDEELQQTALVYVNLSDIVSTWENTEIIKLFNQYRDQLDEMLTSNGTSDSFNYKNSLALNPSVNVNNTPVSELTLTTRGFVRNAFGSRTGFTTTTPTAKNRVQYTLSIKTATLKKNTKLMFVGAMYYNSNYETGVNHWKISDNCLIYENGDCKDLDFGIKT